MRIVLIAMTLLAACARGAEQQAAAPAPPDSAAALAAAEDLAQRYTQAWLARDMTALGATFTENATAAFLGFPTTTGRSGIQALYQAAFDALGVPKEGLLTVTSATGIAPGVLGALGLSRDTFDSSGTDRTTHWRWAATLRQGADGQYRFSYLMAFPDSVVRK